MEAAIVRIGREELAEKGAAGLSLREVARRLGVVSSAVYRYVASRDELLTLLLVDAYTSLADAVDAALAQAEESPTERLAALGRTMLDWARQHPEQWGLIYGAPVPGYQAPEASTGEPGTRVMTQLLRLVAAGTSADPEPVGPTRDLLLGAGHELGVAADAAQVGAAIEVWCSLIGTVNTIVYGQLGDELAVFGDELIARATSRAAAITGLV